jgi:hypothetical protein
MWLLRYSVLKFCFFGVFWGGPLAWMGHSLGIYVIN